MIDGMGGKEDAMQVGTYQNCINGVAHYGAFLNIYPLNETERQPNKMRVHPGDIIEAQGTWRPIIDKMNNSLCLCWHTNLIDETTGVLIDKNALTSVGYRPALDSAALVISSDGKNLTDLSTIYTGFLYTGVKYSNDAGPWKGHSSFGQTSELEGYKLVELIMDGTSVSSLSSDGSSFTVQG